jgi:hypothetical protein
LLVLVLAVFLAGSTVGADSCGTTGSDGGSATRSKRHHKKRQHKKHRHKRRHRARQKPAPVAPPQPTTPREPTEPTTPPEPTCDSNYKGACLDPTASDYDCEGGSGNGPKYTAMVTVVGTDHFDLDRDGDGTACEP